MAVVIVNQIEGGNQQFYDTVSPKVLPDDQLPEGCQLHIAGPTDSGWRVITVWDSEDKFQEFRESKLVPAIQEAGFGDRVSPRIEAQPVYKLVR